MPTLDIKLIIDLPKITDPRGNLTVAEGTVRSCLLTLNGPTGSTTCQEARVVGVMPTSAAPVGRGLQRLVPCDPRQWLERQTVLLNHPWQGLLIETNTWRTLEDFSSGAVCLVLASNTYEEDDYIYDYDEFLNYVGCSK